MADNTDNRKLAAIMLSRTIFLAMHVIDDDTSAGMATGPISPKSLAKGEPKHIRLGANDAETVLAALIKGLCEDGRAPDIVCVGTYGAYVHPEKRLPRLGLEGISEKVVGPLRGIDLRATLVEAFAAEVGHHNVPQIVIETDSGVYAVGENYVRSLPSTGSDTVLTQDDPLAFGFFSGGVGAAVSQNLKINRGLFVGQRGMMPVYPHDFDVKIGYRQTQHPLFFSLAAMTEIRSIEERAVILGYPEPSFSELIKNPDLEIWDIVAHYAAMFCIGMLAQYSPRVIVLGGMIATDVPDFFKNTRAKFSDLLGKLDEHHTNVMEIASTPETYIQQAKSLNTCLYGCLQIAKTHLKFGENNS